MHVLAANLFRHLVDLSHDSYALLTEEPEPTRAVIFVHGFAGHAYKTWADMQDLIAAHDAWKLTDAYFLGYRSTRDEVQVSAAILSRAIATVCSEPPADRFAEGANLRLGTTRYESVWLVGHSLGGVVLRRSILELLSQGLALGGTTETSDMPPEFKLACAATVRLFAPAQGGVRLSGLKGLARQTVGLRALLEMYRATSPSFQELESGHATLQSLREETTHFAEQHPDLACFRARILWAHDDTVVTSLRFRHDAAFTLRDSTHVSVSKASATEPSAFTFLNSGRLQQSEGAL